MVRTRRGAATAATEQLPQPTRASRRKAEKSALSAGTLSPTPEPPAPRRRLRSAKEDENSPLRALPSPQLKRKRAKASTPTPEPEADAAQESDPGAEIFFSPSSEQPISFTPEQVQAQEQIQREIEEQFEQEQLKYSTLYEGIMARVEELEAENESLKTDVQFYKETTNRLAEDKRRLQDEVRKMKKTQNLADDVIIQRENMEGSASAFAEYDTLMAKLKPTVAPGAVVATSSAPESQPDARQIEPVNTPSPSKSFFGRIFSPIKSFLATPTAVAQSPDQSSLDSSDLTMSLTPVPTPVGESRTKTKSKRPKSRRQVLIDSIAKTVAMDLDPSEHAKAKSWVQDALAEQSTPAIGDKRKLLQTRIQVGDLMNVGTKPWHGGSWGEDEELGKALEEDEEVDAPRWAVLRDMLDEEQQPPAKKQKSEHETITEEVSSLNETAIPANTRSGPSIFDSGGNSASLMDLHPRSCRIPSPMFDIPPVHKDGGNVFKEAQSQKSTGKSRPEDIAALYRALDSTRIKRKPMVSPYASPSSFSVPEGDSDGDSDDKSNESGAPLWTQQPPPPPVPAHASLPTPLAESQSAESMSNAKPVDAVEVQRARITKHTPAKPSRLREMHVPSPSLKSDAGSESLVASSPFPFVAPADETDFDFAFSDMPDAEFLDAPPDVMAKVEAYVNSDQFKIDCEAMGWDDPIITFSDDEEETLSPVEESQALQPPSSVATEV